VAAILAQVGDLGGAGLIDAQGVVQKHLPSRTAQATSPETTRETAKIT